jgi:hypothetical protein
MQVEGNSGPIQRNPPVELLSTCTAFPGLILIYTLCSRGRLTLPTIVNSPRVMAAFVINISARAFPPHVVTQAVVTAKAARKAAVRAATMQAKKIKGRKRHIVTDTAGHLIGLQVHPADIQDRNGAVDVRASIRSLSLAARFEADSENKSATVVRPTPVPATLNRRSTEMISVARKFTIVSNDHPVHHWRLHRDDSARDR